MERNELVYAGFWSRVGATVIDVLLIMAITSPLLTVIYGPEYWVSSDFVAGLADFLLSWVFPTVAVIVFWQKCQATPGKMAISAKIVDAQSGEKPSLGRLIWRYFAYFVAVAPLMVGIIWVAFDPKKQGWHDKLAGTVVVRRANSNPEPVRFERAR